MRLTRVFAPGPLTVGQTLALTEAAAHHVARVLRARVGESLHVFDGEGHEFGVVIESVSAKATFVRIQAPVEAAQESSLRITLIQGVSRGERMDWVVQKATELGVARIAPVITTRTVVKLDAASVAKKQEHWRSVAIGAAEQCGRAVLPEITAPVPLAAALHGDEELKLTLDPRATRSLTSLANDKPRQVALLIGPEGGLEDQERAAAERAGFVGVRFGPRILRTETAALAALAILQAHWGDLR